MGVILERKKRILLNEPHLVTTAPAGIANFSTDLIAPLKSCKVEFSPVQAGTGDPSPSNVRPISGWTGCEVYNDPKYGGTITWNQLVKNGNFLSGTSYWNKSVAGDTLSSENGVLTLTLKGVSTSYYNHNLQQILVNGTTTHKYFVSTYVKASKTGTVALGVTNSSPASYLFKSVTADTWTQIGNILELTGSYNSLQVSPGLNYSEYGIGDTISIKNIFVIDLTTAFGSTFADQIYRDEKQSTGHGVSTIRDLFPNNYYDYNAGISTCVSAVNGDPYIRLPVTWSSSGTVYGGYVDLVTGELVATMASVDLGTLTWYYVTNYDRNYFYAFPSGRKRSGAMMCSSYLYSGESTDSAMGVRADKTLWGDSSSTAIKIKDSAYTNANTFKTAMSGVQLAYELATPITYQLTPTQLKSLRGVNNIWSDANGDTTVKFWTH